MRAVLVGVAAGLLALLLFSGAEGIHYRATLLNPAYNYDGRHLHGIDYPWVVSGSSFKVCSDWGAYSNLPTGIQAAIADWESILPKVEFSTVCQSGNQVGFYRRSMNQPGYLCDPGAVACAFPYTWQFDPAREPGQYMGSQQIWFNDITYQFPTYNAWRGIAAHELGHLFGLDDAYAHPNGPCNTGFVTIMNYPIIDFSTNPDTTSGTCGVGFGYLLQGADIADVPWLYTLRPAEQVGQWSSGSNMAMNWYDTTPAESLYWVRAYWQSGITWYVQDVWSHTAEVIGISHTIQTYYMKPANRPGGNYKLCAYVYSWERGYQNYFCSAPLYLPPT